MGHWAYVNVVWIDSMESKCVYTHLEGTSKYSFGDRALHNPDVQFAISQLSHKEFNCDNYISYDFDRFIKRDKMGHIGRTFEVFDGVFACFFSSKIEGEGDISLLISPV